jgi:hypothetical protein
MSKDSNEVEMMERRGQSFQTFFFVKQLFFSVDIKLGHLIVSTLFSDVTKWKLNSEYRKTMKNNVWWDWILDERSNVKDERGEDKLAINLELPNAIVYFCVYSNTQLAYRQTFLYAVFLSANSRMCHWKLSIFEEPIP